LTIPLIKSKTSFFLHCYRFSSGAHMHNETLFLFYSFWATVNARKLSLSCGTLAQFPLFAFPQLSPLSPHFPTFSRPPATPCHLLQLTLNAQTRQISHRLYPSAIHLHGPHAIAIRTYIYTYYICHIEDIVGVARIGRKVQTAARLLRSM